MSGVLLFAAIFLQCKKMGILSALRVAVAKAPALRRTDVRLVDPRFANKFACQEFCFLLLFFYIAKKMAMLTSLAGCRHTRSIITQCAKTDTANEFLSSFLIFSGIFCPEKIPTVLCHPEKNHFLPIFSIFFPKSICKKSNLCYII